MLNCKFCLFSDQAFFSYAGLSWAVYPLGRMSQLEEYLDSPLHGGTRHNVERGPLRRENTTEQNMSTWKLLFY